MAAMLDLRRPRHIGRSVPIRRCDPLPGGNPPLMGITDTAKRAAGTAAGHRISTRPAGAVVRIEHEGTVLAESSRAVALDETHLPTRYYVPREDVRVPLLPSDTTSHCPWKGDATYASIDGVQDAVWVYEDPSEEDAKPIRGLLAPWPGRIDVLVDGKPVG